MIDLSSKKKLILTLFASAFLASSPTISFASKTKQIQNMIDQIQNSHTPDQWPIRISVISVISDQDGPLKVWLGGT